MMQEVADEAIEQQLREAQSMREGLDSSVSTFLQTKPNAADTVLTYSSGHADHSTAPAADFPPQGHMTVPPPPQGHMTPPPPPQGHMTAPPPPQGHMTMPPPPQGHMTPPPPPQGHMKPPPPPQGHMTVPPPPQHHMTAPPPPQGHGHHMSHTGLVQGHPRQHPGVMLSSSAYNSPVVAANSSTRPITGESSAGVAMTMQAPAHVTMEASPSTRATMGASPNTLSMSSLDIEPTVVNDERVGPTSGLFGGIFTQGGFMDKVVKKTKMLSENVITALDPGMKHVLVPLTGLEVVVASDKPDEVDAIREAFFDALGRTEVHPMPNPRASDELPRDYNSAVQAAEVSLETLSAQLGEQRVGAAVQGFTAELVANRLFLIYCVMLSFRGDVICTFTLPLPLATNATNEPSTEYFRQTSKLSKSQLIQQAATIAATQLRNKLQTMQ